MPDCGRQFQNYFPEPINSTVFLNLIAEQEMMLEIERLNSRKACGPDNIGAKVIRLCPRILANDLTRIFNNSIEKCEYTSELKTAKVIAFFRKVETYNPNNYRPISLLSCFNKLFEKLLCKRLVSFLARR